MSFLLYEDKKADWDGGFVGTNYFFDSLQQLQIKFHAEGAKPLWLYKSRKEAQRPWGYVFHGRGVKTRTMKTSFAEKATAVEECDARGGDSSIIAGTTNLYKNKMSHTGKRCGTLVYQRMAIL